MAVEENWTMLTNLTDTTILKINFWHRQRRTIQNKREDYILPIANFPSTSILQQHQHMELYSQLVRIIGSLSNTVIFWTELSCWLKNYSHKVTLLSGWSNHYKNLRPLWSRTCWSLRDSYWSSPLYVSWF